MIEKRSYDSFVTMEGDDTPYQVRGFDPDLMLPDEDVYKPKKKEPTQKTNGLSYRPNFINYSYRQEMISDGIENCLQYVHNFDPDKSKNPFSYFTQIIYFAFIRRIQKEKKQAHIKNKMIEKRSYDTFTTMEGDDTPYQVRGFDPDLMLPDEDVYKPKKKETVQKTNGLENFMESDD